jgi:HEAT repeat protein
MPIRFRCQCGKTIKVGEQYAGRRAMCPNCGAELVVPDVSATPKAPASELQLESERLGPGGKTGATPGDSAPAAAPSAPASEKVCPNCGAAASPNSVICVECNANLMPEQSPAKKTSGIANVFQSLREHKAFPLIAAVAVVVVVLIATAVMLQVRKSKKPAPVPVVQVAPPSQPAPKVQEKPKPPPEPEFNWPGFSDPAIVARDRILKIGRALAAYMDKNHPPATLAEAGVAEADSAGYKYVGSEIAALPRFRALVYEAKTPASNAPYVFFSDGSARPVPNAQSVLLKKTEFGWATDTDAALLAKTAPVIRVANVRFPTLEVALDDKPAVAVPRGGMRAIPAAAGTHQITFAAGGQKEGFQVDLKPGIVYMFVHPRQADLAWIPMREYRAALSGLHSTFTVGKTVDEKKGVVVQSLKGSTESVIFTGDGMSALASDLRSLAARIIREKDNLRIEGPAPDKPILVNKIGRLEAGVVVFPSKGDITVTVTYSKTALGALRREDLPNTDPAAVSLPEAEQGKPPALKPRTTPREARKRTPTTPGTMPAFLPPSPPPQLTFPSATFTLLPDCEALAATLSSSAPDDAVQLLLQRAQMEPQPAEAASARETPSSGVERVPRRQEIREEALRSAAAVRARVQRPQEIREAAPGKMVETGERPLRAQEIPTPLIYAALAFYGHPSAFDVLKQYENTPVESPAYPPLLLALARSGGMSALAYLQTAAAKAPASAVIALCTIDDDAARKALAKILAAWTPDEVAEAVDEWPVVAGPACRIAFVETLASANPALLDDPTALNALMKLEPFALERALAARLAAEPNGPTPPAQPPPTPLHRPAPTLTKAPVLRSAAPLSWIALAHFKNSAAVTRFVQLLKVDNDPAIRLRAAAALGEVRDPAVVPLLTTLLKDKEAAMRRAAARGLAQMPDAAVVGALDAAMDKDLLVSAIVEQAPAIAAKAGTEATAALLAKMLTLAVREKAPAGQASAGQELLAAARQRPPAAIRQELLAAAGQRAPAVAASSTAEPDAATPIMIIEALNHLGLYSPVVKTALEAAREASDPAVRATAYQAREQAISGESAADRSASAIAAAGLALKDKQGIVQIAGIGLLSAAEPKEAFSLLLPALKDKNLDADVRAAALSALPEIADDRVAAAIKDALNDPNPDVVRAAAFAAARRPAFGAAGALANLLANKQPEVRAAAVRALGKLKEDATALNSLLSAVQDKDSSVAAAAIGALGESDAPEAIKAALDALAALGKEALPEELRRQILTHLATRCADSKPYGEWAKTGAPLKEPDLAFLASLAPSTPAARPGLIIIANRYLDDPRPDARNRAAAILGNYTDADDVRATLLKALEQDATGIAQPVADDVLRRVRDDSMIGRLLAYYKALARASPRPAMPAGTAPISSPRPAIAPATAASRFPGLTRATADESVLLRAAIIEALGSIGSDHAGTALKTIADLERNNDDMAPRLIAAFESSKASSSVRDLCEYYVVNPGRYTLKAIEALTRMVSLNPAGAANTFVTNTLQGLERNAMTPPDIAAAAMDALNEINSAGGA